MMMNHNVSEQGGAIFPIANKTERPPRLLTFTNPVYANSRCESCRAYFLLTGVHFLDILLGGVDCPKCGGKSSINQVISSKLKGGGA
jgi:hypothetical protein